MIPTENPGDRPSKLELGRLAAGELSPDALRAPIGAAEQAWLDGVEAARAEVAPFDAAALRARAASLPAEPRAAANDHRGFLALLGMLAVAAVALVVALPALRSDPIDPDYVGVRAAAGLQAFHLERAELVPYDRRPLGDGDVLGFRVVPGPFRSVVVLSIDGTGALTVHWPESGDAPEPLAGSAQVALPGTVVLDGAPGPEVFVAVFERPVSIARAEAARAWQAGGADALVAWAERSPEVSVSVVQRR